MPVELALLCCIPLTEAQWFERAAQAPCGDFVRFVTETRFRGDAHAAWSVFSGEAAFVTRRLRTFADRGMAVILCATADDIAQAAQCHQNVVVLAHWKGSAALTTDQGIPGNRLETWDGMLSDAEFARLFSTGFSGTAYMVVCTSNILAETFRRQHPSAMCICSDDPVRAGLALAKLDAAVSLMSAKQVPLWRGLLEAGDIIDSLAR
jgi:hypothetical protein